ncbi:unnamed protein product, partial [Mesorhabditis spiculigera]
MGDWSKTGSAFVDEVKKTGLRGLRDKFKAEVRHYKPDGSCKVWEKNPTRNRFKDIRCLDSSRVKLQNTENDYIHASWVQTGDKKFILTQGPLQNTAEHFWEMVVENKCATIVMLCDFKECGKPKCFEYFGEAVGEVKFGGVKVKTTTVDKALKRVQKSCFEVTHFRFDAWQDHCAPDDTKTTLRLLYEMLQHSDEAGGPVVIHCSAGVGRTGAFVGAVMALEALRLGTTPMDLSAIVKKLRDQRLMAVQSDLQFLFLGRAALEALAEKKVCSSSDDWYKTFISDYNGYTAHKKKKIEEILLKRSTVHDNSFEESWITD